MNFITGLNSITKRERSFIRLVMSIASRSDETNPRTISTHRSMHVLMCSMLCLSRLDESSLYHVEPNLLDETIIEHIPRTLPTSPHRSRPSSSVRFLSANATASNVVVIQILCSSSLHGFLCGITVVLPTATCTRTQDRLVQTTPLVRLRSNRTHGTRGGRLWRSWYCSNRVETIRFGLGCRDPSWTGSVL